MQDSDIEDAVIDAFKDEAIKCSLEMDEMWSQGNQFWNVNIDEQ